MFRFLLLLCLALALTSPAYAWQPPNPRQTETISHEAKTYLAAFEKYSLSRLDLEAVIGHPLGEAFLITDRARAAYVLGRLQAGELAATGARDCC